MRPSRQLVYVRTSMKAALVLFSLLMVGVLQITRSTPNPAAPPHSIAGAVLEHVASTKVPTFRQTGTAQRRSQQDELQLDKYVTMLPVPSAPQSWMQMCSEVETQGATAFAAWMRADPCGLPDIQGSSGARCQLGRRPWAHQFKQPVLATYAVALFHFIVAGRTAAARQLGAPAPQLSRFDLFHGHIFVAAANSTVNSSTQQLPQANTGQQMRHTHIKQRAVTMASKPTKAITNSTAPGQLPEVGILFHAAEYPAYDDAFPIFLGHCQKNSTCKYDSRAMDLRNILWYKGKLAVLDVGTDSPLHALLHEGTQPLRTVYEDDFGQTVADVLLLKEQRRRRRSLKAAQHLEQQRWHRLLQTDGVAVACAQDASGVFVSY